MDKTILHWISDSIYNDIYTVVDVLGDTSSHSLGYYGMNLSKECKYISGYGFNGTISLWERIKDAEKNIIIYKILPAISGSQKSVNDGVWEENGKYMICCSDDKTSRIYSEVDTLNTYYEIARPQVHGHPIFKVSFINKREHCYVSTSEEKALRVFFGSSRFVESIKVIHNIVLVTLKY